MIDPIGGGPSGGAAGSVPMNVAGSAGNAAGSGNLVGGTTYGGGAGNSGSGGTAGGGSGTAGGGGVPAIQPPPQPDAKSCAQIAAATKEEAANNGACTLVAQVSSSSLQIARYALRCGALAAVDETAALASAQGDINSGSGGAAGFRDADPTTAASGEWVFIYNYDDRGFACVSVRGGVPLFGGSQHWNGGGWDALPLGTIGMWNTSDPAAACSQAAVPTMGFIDLRDRGPHTPLPVATPADATRTVMSTAVAAGLSEYGYVVDGLVALYPGEPGKPDDYIVMLNAVAKP